MVQQSDECGSFSLECECSLFPPWNYAAWSPTAQIKVSWCGRDQLDHGRTETVFDFALEPATGPKETARSLFLDSLVSKASESQDIQPVEHGQEQYKTDQNHRSWATEELPESLFQHCRVDYSQFWHQHDWYRYYPLYLWA